MVEPLASSLGRRGFLTGIGAIICAPAIVRASSLMPVKALDAFAVARPAGAAWDVGPFEIFVDGDSFKMNGRDFDTLQAALGAIPANPHKPRSGGSFQSPLKQGVLLS